jgi:hypothetical protein
MSTLFEASEEALTQNETTPEDSTVEAVDMERRVDQVHSDLILAMYKGKILNTGNGLMMYGDCTGLWSGKEATHLYLVEKKANDIFVDMDEKTKRCGLMTLFRPAYQLASVKAPEDQRFDIRCNSEGYLLFKNGVLDMLNMVMLPFSPDYGFTRKINRDFNVDHFNETLAAEIIGRVFDNPITDVDKREYLLERMSRSVAGCYKDRQFVFLCGDKASGKGRMAALLHSALGEFAGDFNSDHIMTHGSKGGQAESERRWSFISDLWDRRIVISNEIRIEPGEGKTRFNAPTGVRPICGATMKTMVSNGDQISCRKLYENPKSVVFKAGVFVMCNDLPPVEGVDSSFLDRANYIMMDRCSDEGVTQPNSEYFPKDPSIDSFVTRVDVADTFVHLMCR